MKGKIALFLTVFVLFLASCSSPADHDSPAVSENSTSASSETESRDAGPGREDSSTASETDYPALRELSCLQDLNMIEAVIPAQDGMILAFGSTDNGTAYCLADPESDTVTARSETEEYLGIPFAVQTDGEILTINPEEGVLCYLDSGFHVLKTISVQGSEAVYSPSEDCIYVINGDTLSRISQDGTPEPLLVFRNWAEIIAVNPEMKTVLVRENVESPVLVYHYLVYSFEKECLYTIDDNGSYGFAGKTVTGFSNSVLGTGPMAGGALLVYDFEKDAVPAVYHCSGQTELKNCTGSPLVLINEDTYTSDGNSNSTISLVDPQNGICWPVKTYNGGCYPVTAYDAETGCILVGATAEDGCELLVINPSALTKSGELPQAELQERSEEAEITLPAYLAEARALADELEQDYGISICLSTQADLIAPGSYEVHSTTELSPDEENSRLVASLKLLEEVLSVYPQGFYETFKTETGLGGMRFGFFASMRKPDLMTAGAAFQTAAWYNIILDVNNTSKALIHHEIWHAVERRAEGDGFIIDDAEWSAYNPDGFYYRDETDTPLSTDRSVILVYDAGASSSFVEEYSTYAAHEDRATILEYFFSDGQDYLTQYDTLTAAPLLKGKLDLMAAVTRPVFGSVYWEDIAEALQKGQ